MAGKLAELHVEIGAKLDKFNRGMADVEKTAQRVGKKLEAVGKRMTMRVTLPLAALGGACIKMAMDAVESENLFEVSMKGMAGSARKWSEDLRNQFGLNAFEVRKNVATFNVMLKSMKLGEDASYGMAKGLTQLAYDMASFYNLKPEEAFQKLQSGISGEIEPLKRLGILVNETTIKHWALTKGMIKQGEQLSEQQKVVARYNVILEATADAQGDLGRTLDSPTNKLRILKSQMAETAIEMGMKLLPVFEDLLGYVKKGVEWFSSMSDSSKTMTIKLAGIAAATGPLLYVFAKLLVILPKLRMAFALMTGPIGIMIAAATTLGIVLGKVIDDYKAKQDAEMDAMVEAAKGHKEFWAFRKKLIEDEIVTVGEWAEIYEKHGRNYKRVMIAIAKLPEYAHIREKLKGLKDAQEEAGKPAPGIVEASEEVVSLVIKMVDEIKKATLDEFEYRVWAANETYEERKALLEKEKADIEAFVVLERAYAVELSEIEKDQTKKLQEEWSKRAIALQEAIDEGFEAEKAAKDKIQALHAEYTDIVKQLTLSEKDYKLWALDEWYKTELEEIGENNEAKLELERAYAAQKAEIEIGMAEHTKLTSADVVAAVGSVFSALGEKNKALAIAGAIISTYAGAAKSLEMYGMPLAIPFIAMAIIQGMKQVAAIKATSIPSAEEGGWIPKPMPIMAGHGPKGEIIAQPSKLAEIISGEMPQARPGARDMRPQKIIIQNKIIIGEQTFYKESVKSVNKAGQLGDLIVPNKVVV